MKRGIVKAFLAIILAGLSTWADPVSELDYQGKVLVNDLPFTGSGHFKFAITDFGNTSNYWANDGTGSGQPAAHITNSVFNGVFSVILGAAPMTAIHPAIFQSGVDLYLRVWFSTATTGFSAMLPAQKIVSSAYAINAGHVGGQSAGQIVTSAVQSATNAITLAGDITGPPHNNQIAPGVIVDADISSTADIQGSKVQQGTTTNQGAVQLAAGSLGPTVIGTGHPSLNAFSTVNSIVAGAPNSGFGVVNGGGIQVSTGGTNLILSLMGNPLDNVIWVATNGKPSGPGTIERPYDTPQAGYDAAAAAYGGIPSAVVIAGGTYGSGLIMSSGSVHVVGLHRPEIPTLTVNAGVSGLLGFQNVEGIVVSGGTFITPPGGSRVRFHNCRLEGGTFVIGISVLFQNCRIVGPPGAAALNIATFPASFAGSVGVYQSSIENNSPGAGAMEIGYAGMPFPSVQGLEVIGCEIVNQDGATGPAIQDWTPFQFTAFPVKYFSHNYIKGPAPAVGPAYGPPAVADPAVIFPFPPAAGPFIVLNQNVIYGHVGSVVGGIAHPQYFANNTVYGIAAFPGGPSVAGWLQAGAGTGADAAGNIQHEITFPPVLPDIWDD